MATGTITRHGVTVQSVLLPTTITTTETAYTTYGGRQFSDYDLLVFNIGTSGSDNRGSVTLHKSNWSSTSHTWHITANHGANLGNVSGVDATYVSDTSIKLNASGNAAFKTVWCVGYKFA